MLVKYDFVWWYPRRNAELGMLNCLYYNKFFVNSQNILGTRCDFHRITTFCWSSICSYYLVSGLHLWIRSPFVHLVCTRRDMRVACWIDFRLRDNVWLTELRPSPLGRCEWRRFPLVAGRAVCYFGEQSRVLCASVTIPTLLTHSYMCY